jgi:hypothetical protein
MQGGVRFHRGLKRLDANHHAQGKDPSGRNRLDGSSIAFLALVPINGPPAIEG